MTTTIDEFVIAIGVDASKAKKGIQTVTKMLEASTKAWTSIFASFTIAASAAFAQYTKEAEELGRKSKDIGIGVAALNALEMAADRAGGSAADLEKDMKRLADETGGNAYGALLDLAQTAEEMGEAEYVSYAEALGISTTTIDLTKGGTLALKDQMHAMKEMGLITAQDAKLAQDFNRNMKDLWQTFRGIMNIVFRSVLPGFNKVLDWFKRALIDLRKHDTLIKAFFIGLATVITAVVIPAFAKLAVAIMMNPLTWIIGLIAALALVIEDLVVWADGGESAFEDLWEAIFGEPDKAKEIFADLEKFINDVWTSVKNFCIETWNDIVASIEDHVQKLIRVINALRNAFNFMKETAEEGRARIEAGGYNPNLISSDQVAAAEERAGVAADGGIFTSPTYRLIGEAGEEAVIPFSAGKRNRGLELLSKIAGNLMPNVSAAQALPMGGASTNNITTDTRVNVGSVTINAADGTDAASQFMNGIESRASAWTAAANAAY